MAYEWRLMGLSMSFSEMFSNLLTLALAISFFGVLLPWLWSRKRLYALSLQLAGPVALPFVGSIATIIRFITSADTMKAIHKTVRGYSGLVRIWMGPELVIMVHKPEDVESVMKCRTLTVKPPRLFRMWVDSLGNGLLTTPGADPLWKNHRRIVSPTFSTSTLVSYHPALQRHSAQLVRDLEQLRGSGVTDYSIFIGRFLGDYCSESLFDYKTTFREGKEDVIMHAPDWIAASIFNRILYFWQSVDFIYNFSSLKKKQMVGTEAIRVFASQIHDVKMKTFVNIIDKKIPTTIDVLLEAECQGKMSRDEAIEEMMNIWTAAVDTMNIELLLTILMMAIHKECQEKAFQEIREFYKDDRDAPVERDHLQYFPYIEMCIKEAMRIFPAGTVNFRQVTEEFVMKNSVSGNVVIPPKTIVALLLVVSHMDPEVWPEPEVFKPERFSTEEVARRHPYAFYPFSGGQRNCIGQKFGFTAMKTAMVYILRRFELHSDWKLKDIPRIYDVNVRCAWGYMAQFTDRKW